MRRNSSESGALPYFALDGLLSRGELAFFRVLRRAVAGRYSISIKTRLCDVVSCPDFESLHGRRISQKHLDFILYDSWTCEILCAIELDDRSHDRPERRERDQFVERALVAGGVKLIRVKAAARYEADVISEQISTAITNGK